MTTKFWVLGAGLILGISAAACGDDDDDDTLYCLKDEANSANALECYASASSKFCHETDANATADDDATQITAGSCSSASVTVGTGDDAVVHKQAGYCTTSNVKTYWFGDAADTACATVLDDEVCPTIANWTGAQFSCGTGEVCDADTESDTTDFACAAP